MVSGSGTRLALMSEYPKPLVNDCAISMKHAYRERGAVEYLENLLDSWYRCLESVVVSRTQYPKDAIIRGASPPFYSSFLLAALRGRRIFHDHDSCKGRSSWNKIQAAEASRESRVIARGLDEVRPGDG
jgi:hypothetical protein